MKNVDKNIIAALILALGLILSTVIYAYSTRYDIVKIPDGYMLKVDKWNGTISKCEFIK